MTDYSALPAEYAAAGGRNPSPRQAISERQGGVFAANVFRRADA
jgi:hypothetical protein